MNRLTLPINEIQVLDRQRTDMGDLDRLAQSISRYGLICPITVNQNKVLVAGGRRLAACKLLGHQAVDVVYRETLTEDELAELELEENVRRKDMRWQEQCLAIANVHLRHAAKGALTGATWTQAMTAELLGVSSGNVNYCLEVSRHLADKDSPMWKCESFREAWRLRLRMEEDALAAELARRDQEQTATAEQREADEKVVAQAQRIETAEDVEKAWAKERYLQNPLNPVDEFDEYWEEHKAMVKQRAAQVQNVVYLSNTVLLGNCLEHMTASPNTYDHIITDPPYGIEMDMLKEAGHANIDLVEDEHDVRENMTLMTQFFDAAYYCTKETAFVIVWCDIMQWMFLAEEAEHAGFRVQRWPITWVKAHACTNAAPQYNFTKSTEIAMVCRKPGATLVQPVTGCVVTASNAEVKRELRHPFAKPYEVWDFLIDAVALPGQLVLEPFAGTGSGVLAMLRKKLRVVAVESNVTHYNQLVENLKSQYYLKLNPSAEFK